MSLTNPGGAADQDELPVSAARAFSIDDSMTTEIDGLVRATGPGQRHRVRHPTLAAPSLAILPGSPIDSVARSRMSAIYVPG